MHVRDIMHSDTLTIRDTDCLGNAYSTMSRSYIRHLPVLADDKLVGILSERDILAARARVDEADWWTVTVREAMCSDPVVAAPDDEVVGIAAQMAAMKIGAMPIVDDGKLVGIVTATDLLAVDKRPVPSPKVASDIMTAYPLIVNPETDLSAAIRHMLRHHVRHLPVVTKANTYLGMVSERDIRTAVGDPMQFAETRRHPTRVVRVQDVMSPSDLAFAHDTPIAEIAGRFANERVEAAPVLDHFGAIIGIISYVDLLRVLAN